MRIGVFTDIHANLPALKAVLGAFRDEGCEMIVHTGDAVGYGPHTREVVEALLELDQARLLMGNHDEYASSAPRVAYERGMDFEERERYQAWVQSQLTDEQIGAMALWPHEERIDLGESDLVFCHYARNADGTDFAPILREATPDAFDILFDPPIPAIVFHGHDHQPADVQGRNRFVNPGSAGVWGFPVARYAIVMVTDNRAPEVRFGEAPYDGDLLLRDLEARNVPAREYVVSVLRRDT